MTLDEFQRAINDMLATGMRTDFDAAWGDEDGTPAVQAGGLPPVIQDEVNRLGGQVWPG